MCMRSLALVLLLAFPAAAHAQIRMTPADRTALAVTVYQGFGMVRESRRAPAGTREILWTVVPRTIDAGTVLLRGDDRPVDTAGTIVEFDRGRFGIYRDGLPVVLVGPEGERIPAVVVSAIAGPVFRAGERLIVDWKGYVEIPDPTGAIDPAPSIRWELGSPFPGGVLTASYLVNGLSWSADYVAVLDADDRLSLEGHMTVVNQSGIAYPDARLQLVAGVVRRAGRAEPLMVAQRAVAEMAAPSPAPDIAREGLEEYHLYTVENPVTLTADATTQVSLFRAPRVPVRRELVLEAQPWRLQGRQGEMPPEHPEIRLRFVNDRASGLGEPLPGGVIHAYRQDARGDLQFVGDGVIPHTPAGEEVRITLGQAFDVTSRRTQTAWRRIDERTEESAWRIELRNGGDRAREVLVVESFGGDWTILEESRSHERLDARRARWTVAVPADGTTALTYRVRITY